MSPSYLRMQAGQEVVGKHILDQFRACISEINRNLTSRCTLVMLDILVIRKITRLTMTAEVFHEDNFVLTNLIKE